MPSLFVNILRKVFFRLYSRARIMLYQLLSSKSPEGPLKRVQAVHIVGCGRVSALGHVSVGYFPSPHFFSTYGYLEARSKESIIEIGKNTKINNGFVAIAEKTSIIIGENCLIGTRVEIYDSDFHAVNPDERLGGGPHVSRPVRIGSNVFIGSNVRITKGVEVGSGSVIANSSLVSRDVPENCVAAGVPAVVIRRI